MKYAVMTTWKHTNAIDWNGMESEIGDDMPDGSTVQWFAVPRQRKLDRRG